MMLRAVQTPSEQLLRVAGVSLLSRYLTTVVNMKDQQGILSKHIVYDANFSIRYLAEGFFKDGSHLIRRLRDNANFRYSILSHVPQKGAGRRLMTAKSR